MGMAVVNFIMHIHDVVTRYNICPFLCAYACASQWRSQRGGFWGLSPPPLPTTLYVRYTVNSIQIHALPAFASAVVSASYIHVCLN